MTKSLKKTNTPHIPAVSKKKIKNPKNLGTELTWASLVPYMDELRHAIVYNASIIETTVKWVSETACFTEQESITFKAKVNIASNDLNNCVNMLAPIPNFVNQQLTAGPNEDVNFAAIITTAEALDRIVSVMDDIVLPAVNEIRSIALAKFAHIVTEVTKHRDSQNPNVVTDVITKD